MGCNVLPVQYVGLPSGLCAAHYPMICGSAKACGIALILRLQKQVVERMVVTQLLKASAKSLRSLMMESVPGGGRVLHLYVVESVTPVRFSSGVR